MKALVKPVPEDKLRRDFPLAGMIPGWFFRVQEISPGAYRVDGTNVWGCLVSRTGSDRDAILKLCVTDALTIQGKVNASE
jgi:hypothetical protein